MTDWNPLLLHVTQMLYEFNIMRTSLPYIKNSNMMTNTGYMYTSPSTLLSFKVPACPEHRRLEGLIISVQYTAHGEDWVWFAKISTPSGVNLMYNPRVFGKPDEVGMWSSYWPIGKALQIEETVTVSIVVIKGLDIHWCGASLAYTDEQANESLQENKECVAILGEDFSEFQLSTGAYYLCRRNFFELMEAGKLTPDWFRILVDDKIDYTEVGGWRMTGKPEHPYQSYTEVKTIRCIMYGPEMEEIYKIADLSKSSLVDKSMESASELSKAIPMDMVVNETIASTLSKIESSESDLSRLSLQAIDEIQQTILSSNDQETAKSLVPVIISRLTKEFYNILKVNSKSTPSSLNNSPNSNTESTTMTDSASSNTESTTMTDSASSNYEVYDDDVYVNHETMMNNECVVDLRNIVTTMHAFGFVEDCLKVYVDERKFVIDNEFERMKVEKLSKYSAKRLEWGVLKMKIEIWIKAMKVCFKYCFEYEKRLCELIFHDLGEDSMVDGCFMDVVTDFMKLLLDNAEAFSCIRVESERLFNILDVYDTLCGARPLMNKLFDTRGWEVLRSRAENEIVPKLGDKVREILLKFENLLIKEKSPFDCIEPVHKLAKYVVRYVYKLCDYKDTLMGLALSDLPSMDAVGLRSENLVFEGENRFSVHIVWIVLSLMWKLEVKASLCKDPLVSCFFVMNNFRYIIQKVQGRPEVGEMVGDENVNRLIEKFQMARDDYLKLSLEAVLRCLRDEGLNDTRHLPQKVLKLTGRLKRFNAEFEKLQKDLGKSVVADIELALELRKSIVEMVVVAYTSFLRHTEGIPRLQTYIKFSAEEIESVIQEFFVLNSTQ